MKKESKYAGAMRRQLDEEGQTDDPDLIINNEAWGIVNVHAHTQGSNGHANVRAKDRKG